MAHNVKLLISYDGTFYQGWQNSIEKVLKEILEKILQHPIRLQAASRTDAGVHAHGQVVNFFTTHDTNKLRNSLNQLLPKDIAVRELTLAHHSFHPTLDAESKEYRYYVCLGEFQLPYHRLYSWHVYHPLNIELMNQAAKLLCCKRDFSSFCNHRSVASYSHYIREITSIKILQIDNNRLCFCIKGNNFLFRMVRNLVGTLIYIGREKILLQNLSTLLDACNRTAAGITAPAHGLFLHEIFYHPKTQKCS